MRRHPLLAAVLATTLLLAACGDSDGDTVADATSDAADQASDAVQDAADQASDAAGDAADQATSDAEDMVDDMVDDLQDVQDAQGGGGATLTVGEETWSFDSVLCARGEDEIGQEGAEFVLSALKDGLQLYVSIDSFGHSVSLNDIQDFENPSVSLSADPFTAQMTGNPEEFIELSGDSVGARVVFVDDTADGATVDGVLEAACP